MSKHHQDNTGTIAVRLTDGTWSASLRGPGLTGIARSEALAQLALAADLEAGAAAIRAAYTSQANRDERRLRDERTARLARAGRGR